MKNAFRYDDEFAEIPQHNWRQGPDFRSSRIGHEAGYALWGTSRPKVGKNGGDAPTASLDPPKKDPLLDRGAARLLRDTEQIVPKGTNKRLKARMKNKSGIDNKVFRWT